MIRVSPFAFGLTFFWGAAVLAQPFAPSLYSEMQWRCIGPYRGGRTVAISGVPGKPNVFFMAAVNGGVWKSEDFGQVWAPVFDDQPTGSIGAIAIAPSNPDIIYVGSGEGLQRPDLSVGDGVYKSIDGGRSWRHLGLRDGQQIAAMIVDPGDPNRVFAAVLGHPYGPNAERGIFRSSDGGERWHKALYRDENTGAADVAFEPGNPQNVYAVLWAARVAPWEIRSGESFGAPGSALFKSIDGGNTWRQLTQGLPATADGLARIGLGIAPSRPSRIYALAEATTDAHGLYRSEDAGATWARVNDEWRISGRGPGAVGIAVAPDNPDLVYVANTSTYRSTDGGRTFTAIKGAPGGDDYQRIWINPENPQIIALSSDQGATISVNAGLTWSSWYNQPTAQFYHVITDDRFPYWVYGAQQESGSIGTASRSDYGEISFRDWHSVGVEEYGYIAPDPRDSRVLYGGRLSRFDQATGEVVDISPEALKRGKYRYVRTEPVVFSPVDPRTLYFAANVLFKTTSGGRTWQIISPDLTREKYDSPANLGVFSAADPEQGKHRGVIYSVAPSFKNGQLIWVGTDDGLIHLTLDGGKTWRDVTPPDLTPWSKVSVIEASHFDPMSAFAAVNRFRLDDLKPYIYRTRDGGKTWRKITEGLPIDAPVNVIREDRLRKGLLFAGTERSVFVSFDDGDLWQPLQLNLPHTSMRDLTIHGDDLIVGTHGRSFWILDDISPLRQLSAAIASAPIHLYRPQVAYRFRWNRNTDTPLPPEVPAGKNPPDGAILNYHLRSTATGPVTLEIHDLHGNSIRRFSSAESAAPIENDLNVPTYWVRPTQTLSGKAGMHRFVWDLHYPSPDSLEHDYPISAIARDTPRAPRGPPALPGRYMVKLSVGDQRVTQPLVVQMDPRVKTTRSELIRQFELGRSVANSLDQSSAALRQAQRLRAHLKNIKGLPAQGKLAEVIAALDAKAGSLEGKREHSFPALSTAGEDGQDLTRLNQTLRELLELVNGADAAPSQEVIITHAELRRALNQTLRQWNDLSVRDLVDLNAQLKQLGLPEIDL